MKDKDPNEDEFNKDEQDNINEADDSFGLPDLDFKTLDEDSESPEAEEDVVEETSEEVDDVSATAEEYAQEDSEAEEAEEDSSETAEYESNDEEPPKTTYVPPKPESNAPRIIAALIITVVVSAGIWYFMFYRPQAAAEEKARIEALAKQQEADRIAAEQKRAEDAQLKAEQEANTAADADEAANKEATFNIISAPTGRYYIVLNSFLDADMAADYGNKLKAKGVGTTLLAPKGGKKFNRLALADNFGTFLEAQEEANKRKAEFSNDLWVLKY